jgi:endonuclease YncB( thermonuclease family)
VISGTRWAPVDGDTIAMAVDIWPGLTQQATVRVFRVDTPELRAAQQCEKELAAKAAQFAKDFLADAQIWIRPNALTALGVRWPMFRRAARTWVRR